MSKLPEKLLKEMEVLEILNIDDLIKPRAKNGLENLRRDLLEHFTASGLMAKKPISKELLENMILQQFKMKANYEQAKLLFDGVGDSYGHYFSSMVETQQFLNQKLINYLTDCIKELELARNKNKQLEFVMVQVIKEQDLISENLRKMQKQTENEDLQNIYVKKSHIEAYSDVKGIYLSARQALEKQLEQVENMTSDLIENTENIHLNPVTVFFRQSLSDIGLFDSKIQIQIDKFLENLIPTTNLEMKLNYDTSLIQQKWNNAIKRSTNCKSANLVALNLEFIDLGLYAQTCNLQDSGFCLLNSETYLRKWVSDHISHVKNDYLQQFELEINKFIEKLSCTRSWMQELMNHLTTTISFNDAITSGKDFKAEKLYNDLSKIVLEDCPTYNGLEFDKLIKVDFLEFIKSNEARIRVKYITLHHDVLVKKINRAPLAEFKAEAEALRFSQSNITEYFN